MAAPADYLLAWAREPGPRKVLEAVRDRLEGGQLGVRAVLDLPLDPTERAAVGRLLPARWTGSGRPVSVRQLREGLAAHGTGLEELLEAVGGALADRRAAKRAAADRREHDARTAVAVLRDLLGVTDADWDDALRRLVLRAGPTTARADQIARVVVAPVPQPSPLLPVLAVTVFGDAHALDRTTRAGRATARFLALRAARSAGSTPEEISASWVDPASTADAWRAAWAAGGIACDSISSQVLVLNLPLGGGAPAVAQASVAPGEPLWLTLRSMTGEFTFTADQVFVCENPSVLESAADRHGPNTYPLICTFGRPSQAALRLLDAAASAGATIWVRADDDATGRDIVAALCRAYPRARTWRMEPGACVYEEECLGELLADLAADPA